MPKKYRNVRAHTMALNAHPIVTVVAVILIVPTTVGLIAIAIGHVKINVVISA